MAVNNDPEELVRALVDLATVLDRFNHARRRESDIRTGQAPLSEVEVSVTAHLLSQPERTLDELVEATGEPRTAILAALRSLLRRRVVVMEDDAAALPAGRFRGTPTAVALRTRARERATHELRYALAAIRAEDLQSLRSAVGGLVALAGALGYRDVHTSYVRDRQDDVATG